MSHLLLYAALRNERGLLNRLLSFSGNEQENKKAAQEKALRDATNRISFIEDASKRLLEEKISGNVPDSLFKKMFSDYERELGELEANKQGQRFLCGRTPKSRIFLT